MSEGMVREVGDRRFIWHGSKSSATRLWTAGVTRGGLVFGKPFFSVVSSQWVPFQPQPMLRLGPGSVVSETGPCGHVRGGAGKDALKMDQHVRGGAGGEARPDAPIVNHGYRV